MIPGNTGDMATAYEDSVAMSRDLAGAYPLTVAGCRVRSLNLFAARHVGISESFARDLEGRCPCRGRKLGGLAGS
jgi:hypothetical protein